MKYIKLFSFVLIIIFTACSAKTWQITSAYSSHLAIDASTQSIADTNFISYLKPFKQLIDEQMDIVIGESSETMRGHAPESLLSNFNADVYLQSAAAYLGHSVDIAIVNLGGLRTEIPAGPITVRRIFELMPFENELVILWLRGDKLNELLQYFASMGGEGVAGIRLIIQEKKAVNISVGRQPLDINKTYIIATSDYLAGGNDKMKQLALYEKRINTSIKIRNMLLDYIKNESKKGNKIQTKLDGRIQ